MGDTRLCLPADTHTGMGLVNVVHRSCIYWDLKHRSIRGGTELSQLLPPYSTHARTVIICDFEYTLTINHTTNQSADVLLMLVHNSKPI